MTTSFQHRPTGKDSQTCGRAPVYPSLGLREGRQRLRQDVLHRESPVNGSDADIRVSTSGSAQPPSGLSYGIQGHGKLVQ